MHDLGRTAPHGLAPSRFASAREDGPHANRLWRFFARRSKDREPSAGEVRPPRKTTSAERFPVPTPEATLGFREFDVDALGCYAEPRGQALTELRRQVGRAF